MIVKLLDFNFPVDFVLRTMLNCNWQVTSVIKQTELTNWNLSACNGTCTRLLNLWSFFGSVEAGTLSTKAVAFFEDGGSDCRKWNLHLINRLDIGDSSWALLNKFLWEISKCWMLSTRKIFIMIRFPLSSACHWKTFFKMIFKNHLTCWSNTSNSKSRLKVRLSFKIWEL